MSLFDEDLIQKEIIPKTIIECPNDEHLYAMALFERIIGLHELNTNEEKALRGFYSKDFIGTGLFHLLQLLTARSGIKVEISTEVPPKASSSEEFNHSVNIYKGSLLGEYYKDKDMIVLYINYIREASEDLKDVEEDSKSAILLLDVFAHELYHAYFHANIYRKEYEEPLAEFGGLHYLNNYYSNDSVREKKMRALHSFVKSKETCYSLGAKLFEYSVEEEGLYQLIEDYKDNNLQSKVIKRIDDFKKSKKLV